jgi:hypothetical protein
MQRANAGLTPSRPSLPKIGAKPKKKAAKRAKI